MLKIVTLFYTVNSFLNQQAAKLKNNLQLETFDLIYYRKIFKKK